MWLSEVLVSLLLVQLLAVGVVTFSRSALALLRLYEARREAMQTNVLALEMFAREWRVAGYSAVAQSTQGIVAATAQAVELCADFDGDGSTVGTHERIAYRWDATRQAVMRSTQDSSPQPWLGRVPEGGFTLTYLDPSGQPLAPPHVAPELIAGVQLSIHTSWEEALLEPAASSRFHATLVVGRRNR